MSDVERATVRLDLRVGERDAGLRVDVVIAQALPAVSRRVAWAWIRAGRAVVDGTPRTRNGRLRAGQLVSLDVAEPEGASAGEGAAARVVVRYEDDDLLVTDKPAGMVVHPAYRHAGDTLFDALLAHAASGGPPRYRAGLVHRLDKDTSGLVPVTKTAAARAAIQRRMDRGEVAKAYLALVRGSPDEEGAIDLPLERDPHDRRRAIVTATGKPSRTRWRVRDRVHGFVLLEVRLETGRMHQIRAHLAAVGLPIAGDALHGGPPLPELARQFLHAHRLVFPHPTLRHPIDVVSPLPPDLDAVLGRLRAGRALAPLGKPSPMSHQGFAGDFVRSGAGAALAPGPLGRTRVVGRRL